MWALWSPVNRTQLPAPESVVSGSPMESLFEALGLVSIGVSPRIEEHAVMSTARQMMAVGSDRFRAPEMVTRRGG
jgi:hypothetical protein